MLLPIVVTMVLAAGQQAQTPPAAGDTRAQAEQLARSGSYRAALERFQAIAAANPDDVEARVWIARLYTSLGNRRRAVDVYQSIIATHPEHLEAMLGLGRTLISMGRLREASDVLNRAESLAAENAAVLGIQGRLHAAAGRTTLALAYYQRSLTIDPGAAGVQHEYNELLAARAHRVELGYVLEHFNLDIPDPQAGIGSLNARVTDEWRLSATVQHQRKFSRSETRGGAGVEWMARHDLRVHAAALFGGDLQILPESDAYGGIDYSRGRATWSFNLRVADFGEATATVGGGALRVAMPRRSTAWVEYYRFDTDYDVASSDIVHSWVLGASGWATPQFNVGAEYTRGPDQLYLLTIDRLGEFETNTYSAFAEFRFTPMLSVLGRYDYQDRPQDLRVQRAVVRLVQRF